MANRIDPNNKRIKKFNDGNGAILCNGCGCMVKWGFARKDVMLIPERITQEDWNSIEPMYCKTCQEKDKR